MAAVCCAVFAAAGAAAGSTQDRWRRDRALEERLDDLGCTVERVPARSLSAEEFGARLRGRAPVLLTGDPTLLALSRALPSPGALLDRLAALGGEPPMVRLRGFDGLEGSVRTSDQAYAPLDHFLRTFLDTNESTIQFGQSPVPSWQDILGVPSGAGEWPPPPLSESFGGAEHLAADAVAFGIYGGSGFGAPLHAHCETYFTVIHGAKWWFFLPPDAPQRLGADTVFRQLWPTQLWNTLPPGRVEAMVTAARTIPGAVVCLQRPGDIMYLPDFWYHATVNAGHTVGFGQQKRSPRVRSISELIQSYPGSAHIARRAADCEGSAADCASALRHVSAIAQQQPWCAVIPDYLRGWARMLAVAGDLAGVAVLLGVVRRMNRELRQHRDEGAVTPAQCSKEHRQWAGELIDAVQSSGKQRVPAPGTAAVHRRLMQIAARLNAEAVRSSPHDVLALQNSAWLLSAASPADYEGALAALRQGAAALRSRLPSAAGPAREELEGIGAELRASARLLQSALRTARAASAQQRHRLLLLPAEASDESVATEL